MGACLISKSVGLQQQHAPSTHNALTWAVRCIARYGFCSALAKPCKLVAVSSVARSPELVYPKTVSYTVSTLQPHPHAVLVCSEACSADKVYVNVVHNGMCIRYMLPLYGWF